MVDEVKSAIRQNLGKLWELVKKYEAGKVRRMIDWVKSAIRRNLGRFWELVNKYEAGKVGRMVDEVKRAIRQDLGGLWEVLKKYRARVIEGTVVSVVLVVLNSPNLTLIITAWILLFHANETHRMRKEMVNQTVIQSIMGSTPFISISIDKYRERLRSIDKYPEPPRNIHKCWIKNIGEGTAINIELKSLQPIEGVTPFFEKIDVFPKGKKIELEIHGLDFQDDMAKDAFLSMIITLPDTREFFFDLKYKNILYEPYEAQIVLKGGRFSLTEKPKKKYIRY